jgi:hypothetical protein
MPTPLPSRSLLPPPSVRRSLWRDGDGDGTLHSRQQFPIGVRQVDLDVQRAALRIENAGLSRDFALEFLIADLHDRIRAGLHPGGIVLGDGNHDAHRVNPRQDEERFAAGLGRPSQVADGGLPARDDAIIRSDNLGVLY